MDDLRQLAESLARPKGRRRIRKAYPPRDTQHDTQHETQHDTQYEAPQKLERAPELITLGDASAPSEQIPVLTFSSPHGAVGICITVSREFLDTHQEFIDEITGAERECSRHVWGY